jgi:hypothetical protein
MGEDIIKAFGGEARKKRHHSEDGGVDGRMGSEWILGRLAGGCGVDPAGSGQAPMADSCKYGDEPSGFGATELVN